MSIRIASSRLGQLKTDRRFVRDDGNYLKNLAIVSGITKLARGLNLSVVAEGIENIERIEILDRFGVEEGRG